MSNQLDELRGAIEAHLSAASGGVAIIRAIEPLTGGACQDNYRVDVTLDGGERPGDHVLVLRSDAKKSLPGSLDRRAEFSVIAAAVAAGVKTPTARWLAQGLVRRGAWAYFLDWIPGTAIGRRVVRDPDLAAARKGLPAALGAELAKIHTIRASDPIAPLLTHDTDVLAFARSMVDVLREPRPALELCLRWLADHRPAHVAHDTVLLHGDYRTGNFMLTPEGLSGVLDWEFAHWGAREEDVAWLCTRTWRFNQNKLGAGGFARRDDFYRAYEDASGRTVDRAAVHWYEVLGNVRWAAGCIHQGERYLSGEEDDLELIAIPRRSVEMEYEAIRLIEKGP